MVLILSYYTFLVLYNYSSFEVLFNDVKISPSSSLNNFDALNNNVGNEEMREGERE